MTDAEIASRLALMRSIDKPTVDLPLETVERLMATRIGKATTKTKDGKTRVSPVYAMPKTAKIAAKKKADRLEKGLRANRKGKA